MNLGDVLKQMGDTSLKGHVWTAAIISNLNAILPSTQQLTEDSTGRQALSAMVLLPDAEHDRLLESKVDLLQGTLTLTTATEAAKEDPKSETFHQVVMNDLIKDPTKTLGVIFGSMIALLAVIIAGVMTYTFSKTGKAPDTSLFVTFIKALIDLFNALSGNSH